MLRLRYGLIVGEVSLLLAVSYGLNVRLPVLSLALAIAIQIGTNIWLGIRRNEPPRNVEHLVGSLFVFDALCWTLILAETGGPANPFSLLYLVQITFSAVILRRAWTWILGVVSTFSFG